MESGILTKELLESTYEKVANRGYVVPAISMSQALLEKIIRLQGEYLADQKYLNSLLPFRRKEVLLMRKIRNRLKKYKKVNLPE